MGSQAELSTLPRRRRWVNAITQRIVAVGGAAVIAAIALIFIYLLWVVAPIFGSAHVEQGRTYQLPPAETAFLEVNESTELLFRISTAGQIEFMRLATGEVVNTEQIADSVKMVRRVEPHGTVYALLDNSNQLQIFEATYPISFSNDERSIDTRFHPLFGEDPIDLGDPDDFDVVFEDFTVTVGIIDGQSLAIRQYPDAEAGFELEFPRITEVELDRSYDRVFFGPRLAWVYLVSFDGTIEIFDLSNIRSPKQLYRGRLVAEGERLTDIEPLLGRYSILVADAHQHVSQWFLIRTELGRTLAKVRSFDLDAPIVSIVPEQRRKGFVVIDGNARLNLLFTTSERQLAQFDMGSAGFQALTLAPRADLLVTAAADGTVNTYEIDNKHPEISWSSLWSKVWYEGYEEPVYSWQSSSADNDFEAKFSLTPLLFGTIKAAFYAMLVAIPVAIMGALYTAYFMAPVMRSIVKPGIEIMAALPTVILGFLAGLWLAPLIEAHLSAILSILIVMPVSIVLVSIIWQRLPDRIANMFDGWYGLLIIPILIATVACAFAIGPVLEDTFFGGDSKRWFSEVLGLDYDQRNALVVGLAMGLAVIPTIFSISEDAIYGVPTHLINGSLALGATRWQTMMRVVILTASPGIFSAVMIGMGRAVGETMIVLMATGNTPVMDWNIFQGMRTFAANIAVELPESEVDSSHYRILFLAALVLFMLTFVLNTVAELVRQRLRERYGSL